MRTRPSLRFPLTLSPAPYASFEEGWEPRARATTLPSAFSSTASQRGRKAWRRRRKRRERRRWWWRPLASPDIPPPLTYPSFSESADLFSQELSLTLLQ
ncbi:hypothetical protein R6Z07F_001073 [Ovis aries]